MQSALQTQVQHSFDGDAKVLNATFDRRMEIRKALTLLTQELERIEGRPTQITAEIKLRSSGSEAKQHVYTVTITDTAFDPEGFARLVPSADERQSDASPSASKRLSNVHVNGQQEIRPQSATEPDSSRPNDDVEPSEERPSKRPRTDNEHSSPALTDTQTTDTLLKELLDLSKRRDSGQGSELLSFMKDWHTEWVRQGGWLYDNVTKANTAIAGNKQALEKKMDSVQDVLGQSINSANASAMTELANVNKLIPWLEHCRKTSADKVQAREEKWRSSSATFHDQARRDREAADRRIEKKLEEQRELLVRLARVNGVEVAEVDKQIDRSPQESREASLGAQLTRELNMEASKSGNASRSDAEHETINIEDD